MIRPTTTDALASLARLVVLAVVPPRFALDVLSLLVRAYLGEDVWHREVAPIAERAVQAAAPLDALASIGLSVATVWERPNPEAAGALVRYVRALDPDLAAPAVDPLVYDDHCAGECGNLESECTCGLVGEELLADAPPVRWACHRCACKLDGSFDMPERCVGRDDGGPCEPRRRVPRPMLDADDPPSCIAGGVTTRADVAPVEGLVALARAGEP